MRKNTKQIIVITAFVTFSLCFAASCVGYIFLSTHHDSKYSKYRKLERFFYCQKYNTKIESINKQHGLKIKHDVCFK